MSEIKPELKIGNYAIRVHHLIASLIFIAALMLYFGTMAPTTSFWDCGEFIACSTSMGVPHPPGAPFYLILGRVFVMFAPFADIGMKVNALSALVSALTVLFTYLIIVRLVRRWRGDEETVNDKVVLYGSGIIGALSFATSHSFWFNAVEAEVYAISMFFTALIYWLAVRWMDAPESKNSTKYLLLISYFVGLSTGVHLLNVLAVSPIILLIYFEKYKFSWRGLFLTIAISFMAILIVYPGVVSGIPKILHWPLFVKILMALGLIAINVYLVISKKNLMSIVMASVILVLIGYSTYSVIYVRSNLDPEINENQPDTVERLISYLNREQYGAVGPVEVYDSSPGIMQRLRQSDAVYMPLIGGKVLRFHILERKAPFWDYQINKMYVRYLSWQFFIGEKGQVFIMPFLVGLFGMIWHFWRDPKRGFSVGMLFLMTGLAIVFYLNQDNPQPRERDYAYVGSFFAFALWIGIGVAALYEFILDLFKNPNGKIKKIVGYSTVVVMAAAIPMSLVLQNYESHSRKGNYVAWDYSKNMLESCEEGGILFTNGDNDTFPLWYLQTVEGVRKDVRIVNLSLLNTDWYIKQLRNKEPKVPIGFSNRDIDNRLTANNDDALLLRYWPEGQREWNVTKPDGEKMKWNVPATMHIPTGLPNERPGEPNFLRVQDIMILHIMETNQWKKPIYFAVTVSRSNLLALDEYLTMEGLVFRLHPEKMGDIDESKLRKNVFETYVNNYRNLDNPDVYYFDNVVKLIQNYRSGFLQLVYDEYREIISNENLQPSSGIAEEQWGDRYSELTPREKILYTLHFMDTVIPQSVIPYTNRDVTLQIGRIYFDLGDTDSGNMYMNGAYEIAKGNNEALLQVAYSCIEHGGDKAKASQIVDEVMKSNPPLSEMFSIALLYEKAGSEEKSLEILSRIENSKNLSKKDEIALASFYFSKGNLPKSAEQYETLLAKYPGNGEILGGLLTVYQDMKDSTNVVRVLDSWLDKNPTDTRAESMRDRWVGK